MTKKDIIEYISDKAELTKKDAEAAFEFLFEAIENSLKENEQVAIPGFGTFKTSERAARIGRNPSTGKPLKIPARTAITFKPSKTLKDKF